MHQVIEYLEAHLDDPMGSLPFDMRDKADPAGIMLKGGIIQRVGTRFRTFIRCLRDHGSRYSRLASRLGQTIIILCRRRHLKRRVGHRHVSFIPPLKKRSLDLINR